MFSLEVWFRGGGRADRPRAQPSQPTKDSPRPRRRGREGPRKALPLATRRGSPSNRRKRGERGGPRAQPRAQGPSPGDRQGRQQQQTRACSREGGEGAREGVSERVNEFDHTGEPSSTSFFRGSSRGECPAHLAARLPAAAERRAPRGDAAARQLATWEGHVDARRRQRVDAFWYFRGLHCSSIRENWPLLHQMRGDPSSLRARRHDQSSQDACGTGDREWSRVSLCGAAGNRRCTSRIQHQAEEPLGSLVFCERRGGTEGASRARRISTLPKTVEAVPLERGAYPPRVR